MLNVLWPLFIIISIIYGLIFGNLQNLNSAIFKSCESAISLTLTLLGTTCLWCGLMKIVSKTRIIKIISRVLKIPMKLLFQNIDMESEEYKCISMNLTANILGLGNAATPLGLKAMSELNKNNKNKSTLDNNMMMLIVLNTASLQIIPTTIIAIRSSYGSINPSGIIVPVWISTICAAFVGIIVTKIIMKFIKE